MFLYRQIRPAEYRQVEINFRQKEFEQRRAKDLPNFAKSSLD
jgi:hypothetical protein